MPGWKKHVKQADPDPGDVTDVDVDVDPEHEWRMRMLVEAGFSEWQSFRLSFNGADWHEATAMLDAGADADQVVDILI